MKRRIAILMAKALCMLFCVYPLSTTVFGADDKITIKLENIDTSLSCNFPDESKLPDVVVTYKDGVCTVKNIPTYKRSTHGWTNYAYKYWGTGSAGVFVVMSGYERGEDRPEYFLIDTNKTSTTTAKIIDVSAHDSKVLSNGITAFLDSSQSVVLVSPDNIDRIKLAPSVPDGYEFATFGVDYCPKSKRYAVMYGLFPKHQEPVMIYNAAKRAGVALFDESGKPIKQFLLKDLYCTPPPPLGFGSEFSTGLDSYEYCIFSSNPNILYAGGMIPKTLYQKWKEDEDYEITYEYYKINLMEESYTGISKLPESKPEFPFKIQYNKTGTHIYTKSGDEYKTLASLKGDYIAASYSVNLDCSIQMIFVPDAKTGMGIHPIAKSRLLGSIDSARRTE